MTISSKAFFPAAWLVLSLLSAPAWAVPEITNLSPPEGSAAGGEVIHIYGTDFGTPGVSTVAVTFGGAPCTSAQLVAVGDIQCETPAGTPDTSVEVAVTIDSISSVNTYSFAYMPRPYIGQAQILAGYDDGYPMLDNFGMSAGGGETLVINGAMIGDYVHWMVDTQPASLQVLVGGNPCTNAEIVWSGPLVPYSGSPLITCTTPAGAPGVDAEIELSINGVQDQMSFNDGAYLFTYMPRPYIGQAQILAGYDDGYPMLDNFGMSAGGGETLVINGAMIGDYVHWMVDTQPASLQVLVGGNPCTNAEIVWSGPLVTYSGSPLITCTTPAGAPGVDAEIELSINGVQDQMSFNDGAYLFAYMPRPYIGQAQILAGYDGNGYPMLDNFGMSAGGGETLVINGAMIGDYVHWMVDTQPASLQVLVGGNPCTNAEIVWSGPLVTYSGSPVITCTTPAGEPGVDAEIELSINGVQDHMSFNDGAYLFAYIPRPWVGQARILVGGFMLNDFGMSAGGGETLVISVAVVGDYVHWIEGTQPSSLQVLVDGNACTNAEIVWSGPLLSYYTMPPGSMITCTTPTGEPGTDAEIKLFIDGVQDYRSFNNTPATLDYLPRPWVGEVSILAGYYDYGQPLLDNFGMSAGGGETLVIKGAMFGDYVHWMVDTQPNNLQVTVGGAPCTNPVIVWSGPLVDYYPPAGSMITCTTPAGEPGINAEIRVFIDGVQDYSSVSETPKTVAYLPRPWISSVQVVVGYDPLGAPISAIPSGFGAVAAGGDTLLLYSMEFGSYAGWVVDAQPDLQILVGGEPCTNPVLHWNDGIGNAFSPGTVVTCTTPAGPPGSNVEIELSINGIQDYLSFSGVPARLSYLPRPYLNSIFLLGYDGNNTPIALPPEGSAAGGDTLVLLVPSIADYLHGQPNVQPDSMLILIGGAACTNPVLHWSNDPIANIFGVPGNTEVVTCTTPPGTPNTQAEVELFIDGVQDQLSFDGAGLLFHYLLAAPVLQSINPAQGPDSGGTLLTLNGENFYVGLTVDIGGMVCVVQSLSATEITCITGPHPAGTYGATVNTGGASTNSVPFEYTGQLPLDGSFKGLLFQGGSTAQ